MPRSDFELPDTKKPIKCAVHEPEDASSKSILCLSHGAGGTMDSPAMAEWISATSATLPVAAFNGNMNLKSRVKHFRTLVEHLQSEAPERPIMLGGRSMGSRAAVTLYNETPDLCKKLVLQSYPLKNQKPDPSRAELLRAIPEDCEVLFVIGSRDAMCPLEELVKVRHEMQANSWMIVVEGANHGMEVLGGKAATSAMRQKAGELAGEWVVADKLDEAREGKLTWVDEEASWTGWLEELPGDAAEEDTAEDGEKQSTSRKREAEEPTEERPSRSKRTKTQ